VKGCLFFISFILAAQLSFGQKQYIKNQSFGIPSFLDKAMVEENTSVLPLKDSGEHSPRRATVYSALVPGLGQIYNEKYWKVGLLYAAGGTMVYFFKYNQDSMKSYQKALDARVDGLPNTVDLDYPSLSDAKVIQERNYYRRNRDMLILGFIGVYALQILDASVDAHLREFDINDDLSMHIKPIINYDMYNAQIQSGMSIALRF
jgi:hypothetical protein